MSKAKHGLICLLLFIVGFTAISTSYTWFTNSYEYQKNILGRTRISYFAAGDGSELDPFIIAEPEHMFNLSALNELGTFSAQPYYFKVADPITGNPIEIDFSNPNVPEIYQTIKPIGDNTYPFIGIFDGNNSIITSLTIDGQGRQDIGVFGYVQSGAQITNFFIQTPTILSNPSSLDDKTNFHVHNNQMMNRATGSIVGHIANGALVENVFVIDPTINSLSNADANRSQYALIGYNEADGGVIQNSPRNAYDFILDATSAYAAITYAQTTYANYFINGSSTLRLSNVLSNGTLSFGYSLSTLRISPTANDPDPVFLYDQLVLDGYTIGANGSEYSRENIDVVGQVQFGTSTYQIFQNLSAMTTPAVNSTFNPNNHPDAMFLYVRPTNNPDNLGNVTGLYGGGGELSYLSGYDANGNYVPNRSYTNKNSPGVINFGNSGVTQIMTAANAWAAVVEETDPVTGDPILRVVDETVIPDYYIFLVAVTNGQSTFSSISFEYTPQSTITVEDFDLVSAVDYIHPDQITTIRNDINDNGVLDNYVFSLLYLSYDIVENQALQLYTERLSTGNYNVYIDYAITDTSFFYFDIFNVSQYSISLYINGVFVDTYTNTIIGLRFLDSTYEITLA